VEKFAGREFSISRHHGHNSLDAPGGYNVIGYVIRNSRVFVTKKTSGDLPSQYSTRSYY
jgi:hypothetical protein